MKDDHKRKRGRPKEGSGKDHRLCFRVSSDFYNEFKKLCELEGKSQTDYIVESVRINGNITRFKVKEEEETNHKATVRSETHSEDDFPEDYYMDEDYDNDDFYD